MPGWLWMLIGGAATLVLAGGARLLLRRRTEPSDEEAIEQAMPVQVAEPVQPPSPPPAPPRAAERAVLPPSPALPVQQPQSDPFDIRIRPARIELGEREIVLDFELLVGNLQSVPAEGARLSLAMISANPDQDRILDSFHRGPPGDAGEPFDLAPGGGARVPVRLALPRERVHVVQLGGRPMFVAMVLVDLRWRSGLSIRRFGADFMVGAAGQGDRIGPIWLDRGHSTAALGATRYLRREMAAA